MKELSLWIDQGIQKAAELTRLWLHTFQELSADDWFLLWSINLSIPSIVYAIMVAYIWHKKSVKALWDRLRSEYQWFLIGIYISFIGTAADGTYWTPTWSSKFVSDGGETSEFLFWFGSYANILLRYLPDTIAAYCHLRAARESNDLMFKFLSYGTVVFIIFYDVILIMLRGLYS